MHYVYQNSKLYNHSLANSCQLTQVQLSNVSVVIVIQLSIDEFLNCQNRKLQGKVLGSVRWTEHNMYGKAQFGNFSINLNGNFWA